MSLEKGDHRFHSLNPEALPVQTEHRPETTDYHVSYRANGLESHAPFSRSKLGVPRVPNTKLDFPILPLCLAILPVVLLAAYSGRLSIRLGYNGCLPNGEFALPYTSSIWAPKHFFVITMAFKRHAYCEGHR